MMNKIVLILYFLLFSPFGYCDISASLPSGLTFYTDYTAGVIDAQSSVGSATATFTCTRTGATVSPGTYINSSGIVTLMAATDNLPRYTNYVYDETGLVPLKGIIMEIAKTNLLTYSYTYENAAWDKTDVTANDTDSGSASPDGTATATSLTATGANGTVLRNAAVTGRTYSVYLKRKTGTGSIYITANGGTTWTEVTVLSGWARFSVTATSASQKCGIKIATSGDAVYAWVSQYETGAYLSSTIPTTTASLTRNADKLKYEIAGNRTVAQETIIMNVVPLGNAIANDSVNRILIGTETKDRRIGKSSSVTTVSLRPNNTDSVAVFASTVDSPAKNIPFLFAGTCQHATNPSPTAIAYNNGVEKSSDTTHGDWTDNVWGTYFYVGSDGTGNLQFGGIISSVSIFNRVLSSSEILSSSILIAGNDNTLRTYYVASDGSGTLSTLSQVNSAPIKSGDSVLFKKGDSWRGRLVPLDGSPLGYITYGAYGNGVKPRILGSITANSGWTDLGGNIWQHTGFSTDIGNLIFNNEESCGIKQMAAVPTLDTQGDFWYDFTNDLIKLYSTSDPATFYSNIECAVKSNIISSADYVILENLDLRYGANHGINGGDNVIYRDLDISYIGGGDQNSNYATRLGNGIEFFNGHSNILVERCRINQIYDAAVTTQSSSAGASHSNIIFRNNILTNSEYSFEVFASGAGSIINGVYFLNNTCKGAGSGWGHSQRPDGTNGRHFLFSSLVGDAAVNFVVKNNIFDTASESALRFGHPAIVDDVSLNNNCYNVTTVGTIYNGGTPTDYTTLSDWRTVSSQEANSTSSDPLFISITDYHLQKTSPCINKGVNLTNVVNDFEGVPRPVGSSYDIGAYEWFHIWLKNVSF